MLFFVQPTSAIPEVELDTPVVEEKTSSQDIRQFFLDYHKRKQIALGEVDPGELSHEVNTQEVQGGNEGDDEGASFDSDRAPDIPLHVKYVTQVRNTSY